LSTAFIICIFIKAIYKVQDHLRSTSVLCHWQIGRQVSQDLLLTMHGTCD